MNKSFSNDHQYNIMILTGQGQITTIPNEAIIRLGVQLIGDNLVSTQAENARITQDIIQSLNEMDVADIKTFQYSIDKNYIYEDGNRIDNGYSVRNMLEIKLDKMEQVGTVIDTAVNHGANVVEFISFEVSDPDLFYQQALNLALRNAIQKATSIAMYLGLPMEPVPVGITENSPTQTPFPQFRSIGEGNYATPIQPGQYEINASVTVEFLY